MHTVDFENPAICKSDFLKLSNTHSMNYLRRRQYTIVVLNEKLGFRVCPIHWPV